MSKDNHSDPSEYQMSENAKEAARHAADTAKETAKKANATAKEVADKAKEMADDSIENTRNAVMCYADKAKDMYHTTKDKAEETLTTSKDYVRRNPVPVVLGAIAFGTALGCWLMMARRKPTFSERYADEPMGAVREAILGAIAPVTQRVHDGYDSARNGAEKAMDRMHRFGSGRSGHSFSDRMERIGNNLKFW